MAKKEADHFQQNLASVVADSGYGAVTRLASHMGMHRVTMSEKIHGRDPIYLPEAAEIAEFYGYSLADMLVPPKQFRKKLLAS